MLREIEVRPMNSVSPVNPPFKLKKVNTGLFGVVKTIVKSDIDIVRHDKWYYLGLIINIVYVVLSIYSAWYFPPKEPNWLSYSKKGLLALGMLTTATVMYRSYPELKRMGQIDQIFPQ